MEKKKIMENSLVKKYFGFEEIYEALKKGRRIVPFSSKNYIYQQPVGIKIKDQDGCVLGYFDDVETDKFAKYENQNINNIIGKVDSLEVVSVSSGKHSKILYYYANPQMNRTFCKCEDGSSHDEPINIIDNMEFYDYDDFVKANENKCDKIEVTISDLEKMIGKKIVIKGE